MAQIPVTRITSDIAERNLVEMGSKLLSYYSIRFEENASYEWTQKTFRRRQDLDRRCQREVAAGPHSRIRGSLESA